MVNSSRGQPGRNKVPVGQALSLAVAAVLAGGAVRAQELEEVVVTATKRERSLQDVPVAVTSLSGADLTSVGVDSQRTLSMVTPNVAVNVNASFIVPYIRGVGTQYANPGLEPSVATYFNDAYIARPSAGFMQFSDVERVEVLKGPQGTLYGRNTTGGAIRIITKDPTDEFDAGLGVTLGNYSQTVVDGFVSGPIGDGGLKGRLAAQYETRDAWVDNIVGGADIEDREIYMVHGKLLWEPNDALRIKLSGDYTEKDDREGIAFQALFPGAPEQVAAAFGGIVATAHDEYSGNVQVDEGDDLTQHSDFRGAELRIDYDFGPTTLSSISAYRYTRFQGVADLDGTSLPWFEGQTVYDKTEDYSQEFQLVSNGSGPWDWILGLYYLKEDAEDNFGFTGLLLSTPPTPTDPDGTNGLDNFVGGDGTIEIESLAPYGEISYDLTDQWEILVGFRYTDETKDVTNDFYVAQNNGRTTPISPYLVVVPVPDDTFSFNKFTPKAQVSWRPQDQMMFYATYSEGLKSGGFNMPSPSPAPVTEVNNETIKAFEIGWKTEFDRVRFNGAVFHYDIEDLQVQVTDLSGGITTVRNAGDATVDGIEGEVTFAATEYLQLDAGAGWQDAQFESVPGGNFNPPCAAAPTDPQCQALGGLGLATVIGNLEGNELPHAPPFTAYARGTYTWPLAAGGDLGFGLVVSYSDEFFYTPDNLYREPSKVLANANVGWTSPSDRFRVTAFVNNLTDEEYYTHNSPLSATGGWKVPAPPMTYGVRLNVDF
jgi:iron complex outermembrane recepter protein